MDEEKLKKELESEGEEFFKEVDEMHHEDPGAEDKEDLDQEFKVSLCCCLFICCLLFVVLLFVVCCLLFVVCCG